MTSCLGGRELDISSYYWKRSFDTMCVGGGGGGGRGKEKGKREVVRGYPYHLTSSHIHVSFS